MKPSRFFALISIFLGFEALNGKKIESNGEDYFPTTVPTNTYKFFIVPLSWQEAVEQCELHGMQLLSITGEQDGNERKWIQDKMVEYKLPQYAWTGLNIMDSREWRWLNSEVWMKGEHDEWEDVEDNDRPELYKCGAFCKEHAKYRSKHCSEAKAFICKYKEDSYPPVDHTTTEGGCPRGWIGAANDNKCYRIHGHRHWHDGRVKTWTEANEKCQEIQEGGLYPDLVHFSDLKSTALIMSKLETISSDFWIGLKQIRMNFGYQWAWSDNKPLDMDIVNALINQDHPPPTPSSTDWNGGYCAVLSNNGKTTGQLIIKDCEAPTEHGYGYICQIHKDKEDIYAANRTDFTKFVTFGKDQYKLVSTKKKTWEEANKVCQQEGNGAHLASIYNEPTNAFLTYALMETMNTDAIAWIGFKEKDYFYEWIDGGYPFYTRWGADEPFTKNDDGGCVYISKGRWFDADCTEIHNFFCKITQDTLPTQPPITEGSCPLYDVGDYSKWTKHGGYCYYTSKNEAYFGEMTWEKAQKFCQNSATGGHLVSIHTEAENDFITKGLLYGETLERHWIGLQPLRDGSYVWEDGSPFNFEKWAPDIKFNTESCGYYNTRNFPEMWSVADCAKERYHFICKVEEGEPMIDPPEIEGTCPMEWVHKFDSCYKFEVDTSTFHNAEEQCTRHSEKSHLVSIHSYAEFQFVTEQMDISQSERGLPGDDGSYWIGLERTHNSYEWLDKSAYDYKNWYFDITGHEHFGEQCVKMDDWGWYIVDCVEKQEFTSFVCKMPKGKLPHGLTTGGITAISISAIVVVLLLVVGLLFLLSSLGIMSAPTNPFSKSYDRHTDEA